MRGRPNWWAPWAGNATPTCTSTSNTYRRRGFSFSTASITSTTSIISETITWRPIRRFPRDFTPSRWPTPPARRSFLTRPAFSRTYTGNRSITRSASRASTPVVSRRSTTGSTTGPGIFRRPRSTIRRPEKTPSEPGQPPRYRRRALSPSLSWANTTTPSWRTTWAAGWATISPTASRA